MTNPKLHFHHEKLIAYQRSIEFVAWSTELLEQRTPKLAVLDQLDRASTSIPLNIAEGNGKHTAPDRCRYLENARGSALECAACLDVLVAKGRCTAEEIQSGKETRSEIVALLVGLIRSVAPDRLSKAVTNRRVEDQDQDRDQEREADSAHSQ
jgi:four helix bundle protein